MKLLLLTALLCGCAGVPLAGICIVQAIGESETGGIAVRYRCEAIP